MYHIYHITNILSIEELVYLADKCDCTVYNRKSAYDVHVSKKILGLIRLSELNDSVKRNTSNLDNAIEY